MCPDGWLLEVLLSIRSPLLEQHRAEVVAPHPSLETAYLCSPPAISFPQLCKYKEMCERFPTCPRCSQVGPKQVEVVLAAVGSGPQIPYLVPFTGEALNIAFPYKNVSFKESGVWAGRHQLVETLPLPGCSNDSLPHCKKSKHYFEFKFGCL